MTGSPGLKLLLPFIEVCQHLRVWMKPQMLRDIQARFQAALS